MKVIDLNELLARYKLFDFSVQTIKENLTKLYETTSQIHHPNIVSIQSHFSVGEKIVVCMELVEGRNLLSLIPRGGMTPEVVKGYFFQILTGMAYCHEAKVVHGNLKPENILVRKSDNQIKIIDFGLHTFENSHSDEKLKVGWTTTVYSPPCDNQMSCSWDDWSSGVLLFVMLFATLPFSERQLLSDGPLELSLSNYVPDEVIEIFEGLLNPNRFERRTAADLVANCSWLASERQRSPSLRYPSPVTPGRDAGDGLRRYASFSKSDKKSSRKLHRIRKAIPIDSFGGGSKNSGEEKREKREKRSKRFSKRSKAASKPTNKTQNAKKAFSLGTLPAKVGYPNSPSVMDREGHIPSPTPAPSSRQQRSADGRYPSPLVEPRSPLVAHRSPTPPFSLEEMQTPRNSVHSPSLSLSPFSPASQSSSSVSVSPPIRPTLSMLGISPISPVSISPNVAPLDLNPSISAPIDWLCEEEEEEDDNHKLDVWSAVFKMNEAKYCDNLQELIKMRDHFPASDALVIIPNVVEYLHCFHKSLLEFFVTTNGLTLIPIIVDNLISPDMRDAYIQYAKVYSSAHQKLSMYSTPLFIQTRLMELMAIPLSHSTDYIGMFLRLRELLPNRERSIAQCLNNLMHMRTRCDQELAGISFLSRLHHDEP